MATQAKVADITDIPPVTTKEVSAEGQELLVVNVGGRSYVIDNRCPHRNVKLSSGTPAGPVVAFTAHRSRFDVTDGSVVAWVAGIPGPLARLVKRLRPRRLAKVHEVTVEDESVFITLP